MIECASDMFSVVEANNPCCCFMYILPSLQASRLRDIISITLPLMFCSGWVNRIPQFVHLWDVHQGY